jgi:hypothetical protein
MSIMGQVASRTAQVAPYLLNPVSGAVAATTIGGTYLANRELNRRRAPQEIGSQIGSASNFDAISELTPRQQDMMKNWDERQVQQYQSAIAESAQNSVRLGQMTPEDAQARVARASYTLNPAETQNSGQLQMGAMSATDLPDATSQLGDYNGLGLDNEYWSQLRNAAAQQENITQGVGDMQVSREFDRTAKYRLPIENYRMGRDFAYGQKAEQNSMKRGMAQGMLNSYTNTAQALITSGL